MIERALVWQSLESKRSELHTWMQNRAQQSEALELRVRTFLRHSAAEINELIDARGQRWPGARPTEELDRSTELCFPFGRSFDSHEEWRAWATGRLLGHPVGAVDGSQIAPDKEYSPSVGAVQVGWFINDHTREADYTKQVEFEVITPGELVDAGGDSEGLYASWYINQRRFVGECRRLVLLMREARESGGPLPLLLFDGSFIVSFASQMLPERSHEYIEAVRELLTASEQWQVPLVAFVDTSTSRDLANLIDLVNDVHDERGMTDAGIMSRLLPLWGDRGPLFYCARDDALSREGVADFYPDVAFTYLRTVQGQPPARIELPRWMIDAGLVDQAFDLLRAECAIGGGYPYTMQAADALAVLNLDDRKRFHAVLERYLEQEQIPLHRSRKAQSKLQRRA